MFSGLDQNRLDIALAQIETVCSKGKTIKIFKAATKDDLGEAKTDSVAVSLKSFPVRRQPFNRNLREKISWSDEVGLICFVSKKAVYDAGYTVKDLKGYKYMTVDSERYEISQVEFYSNYADDYLYIAIGGNKK